MNSELRDSKNELLLEIGRRLERFGFSARPREQSYYREMNGGKSAVHLSIIPHESDFDVTVDVAVRFDAVEELVNRFNSLLSAKEKKGTFTLGAELGNMESGKPFRVTLTGTRDVASAANTIMAKIETVGLPYLERYSQPEVAYSVLARDDREAWMHCPLDDARAKRACAMLAVLGRHSEIKALGQQKQSYLKANDHPGVATFRSFLEELTSE